MPITKGKQCYTLSITQIKYRQFFMCGNFLNTSKPLDKASFKGVTTLIYFVLCFGNGCRCPITVM